EGWDDVNHYAIWRSDGTETGTAILKDTSFYADQAILDLHRVGDYVVFSCLNQSPLTLWRTDGTAENTAVFKTFYPSLYLHWQINADGQMFFNALVGGVWRTDGTEAGTILLGSTDQHSEPGHSIGRYLLFSTFENTSNNIWI